MVSRVIIAIILSAGIMYTSAQSFEFSEPERLSLSSDGEEMMPLLFPDGSMLFFGRTLYSANSGGDLDGSDVWVSRRSTDGWKRPSNSEFPWNNSESNVIVGINEQGTGIYVLNGVNNKRTPGIHYSKRVNNGWSKPQLIPIEGLAQDSYLGLYVAPTEDVILISMKGEDSFGEEDLYVSVKDKNGKWSVPKNLGPAINTKGYEISPFLTPDKKKLFFASNGHPGEGDADIFYAERLYSSWETWSVPKNLGKKINSKGFDAYLSMYGDSLVHFVSNRSGRLSDVYQSKAKIVWTPLEVEGRQYLKPEEVNELIGTKVQRSFTFDQGVTNLSVGQQELLWYIAGKVIDKKDIKVYLRALKRKEDDPKDLYEKRLSAMIEHLRLTGIDPVRIKFGIETVNETNQLVNNKDTIQILFFR